jgi:hypothetical protein
MGRRVLLGMAVTFALAFLSATAFAQAAAEATLGNAASASAAAKAGSVLGRALNQSSKQLAGRVQEQTANSRQSGVQQNRRALKLKSQARAGAVRTDSAPGNLITSIQGGEVTCAPTDLKSQASGGKANTPSKDKNCRTKDLSLEPAPQDKN